MPTNTEQLNSENKLPKLETQNKSSPRLFKYQRNWYYE
jgi:hypothetical protein